MKRILKAFLRSSSQYCLVLFLLISFFGYGFHTSILSIDELSRLLFVWLTFIGAIVAYMDNSHVQVTFLVENSHRLINNVFRC